MPESSEHVGANQPNGDLSPNLGDYQPDNTFLNNEAGEKADSLYGNTINHQRKAEVSKREEDALKDQAGALRDLALTLKNRYFGRLSSVEDEAMKTVLARLWDDADKIDSEIDKGYVYDGESYDPVEDKHTAIYKHADDMAADESTAESRKHLKENREAYENQAVNDYKHAQAADPDRYPDPLKYPSDTKAE